MRYTASVVARSHRETRARLRRSLGRRNCDSAQANDAIRHVTPEEIHCIRGDKLVMSDSRKRWAVVQMHAPVCVTGALRLS
jgi:hypothetical protein